MPPLPADLSPVPSTLFTIVTLLAILEDARFCLTGDAEWLQSPWETPRPLEGLQFCGWTVLERGRVIFTEGRGMICAAHSLSVQLTSLCLCVCDGDREVLEIRFSGCTHYSRTRMFNWLTIEAVAQIASVTASYGLALTDEPLQSPRTAGGPESPRHKQQHGEGSFTQ